MIGVMVPHRLPQCSIVGSAYHRKSVQIPNKFRLLDGHCDLLGSNRAHRLPKHHGFQSSFKYQNFITNLLKVKLDS